MTINDLGSVANILSAIAVLATLIFLSVQVRQANMLARAQARERMVEQTNEELYQWMGDSMLRECFAKPELLTREEHGKVHYFLLAAMRQREWEWFQYKDGIIKQDVYRAYQEVIGLHLGVPRTRHWWSTVGRVGFNPAFVAEVDALLADRPPITYFEDILTYDRRRLSANLS